MPTEFEEISGYPTVLVISGAEGMLSNSIDILKKILKDHDSGVYITVNQPYKVLSKVLEVNGIDINKMYFIDCITNAAGGGSEKSEHCLYMSSPSNLTELSLGVFFKRWKEIHLHRLPWDFFNLQLCRNIK
jgi:hypothetical protein